MNQDNALLNDEKSNEEHKVNVALKDTVNLNKELKVAEVAKDGVILGSKPNVTGSQENDVKATNSLEMKEETLEENKSTIELKLERKIKVSRF